MRDYVIAVSSTADLNTDWLSRHQVPFIPYHFVMDGVEYKDDCREETKQMVYDKMRNGFMLTTSAISQFEYFDFFEQIIKQDKDLIYLDMCSALSSSINNAAAAVERIREKYPDSRIYFLDSFAVTGILGVLVKDLVSMKEAGCSMDEVIAYGEANKFNYIGRFMVDDLEWLRRGGRLSNASALLGTLLAIKPMIYVSKEGKLVAYGKAHGKRKTWSALISGMKNEMNEETVKHDVTVIHSGTEEDAEIFRNMIAKEYPHLADRLSIMTLGPVITAHVGPGFMAVVYYGKEREL